MEIEKVTILNFRSISYVSIDFKYKCRILVGINETGKTNILKALSLLSEEVPISKDDIREPLPNEDEIRFAYVQFIFRLNKEDKNEVFSKLQQKIRGNIEVPIVRNLTSNKKLTLQDFIAENGEILFEANLKRNTKGIKNWRILEAYELLSNWKKPDPDNPIPKDDDDTSESLPIEEYSLIHQDELTDINDMYFKDASTQDLITIFNQVKTALLKNYMPETIFWEYDDRNILPQKINTKEFIENPDLCLPLKNMFHLAEITDINSKVSDALKSSSTRLKNLLNRVAEKNTNHFQSVWKEYKDIKFELTQNGDFIEPSIKDKFNNYAFEQRSDGFKRFVTFMLIISTKVKLNLLENVLLLYDEPEISLHPTGAKYLRDELIKISKSNYVVYSTHSIFMIDNRELERHLITQKIDEKTITKESNKSNIIEEEVLLNALNYSAFEIIKEKNILFEGWKDKRLFQVATNHVPNRFKHIKKPLSQFGICHAEGVKDIRHITPILELAGRDCFIISDCDKPAKEKQTEYSKLRGYGTWKRYDQVMPETDAITGEDFVKPKAFEKPIKAQRKDYKQFKTFPFDSFNGSNYKIKFLKDWMNREHIDQNKIKPVIKDIKDYVFDNLKYSQIEDSYYEFLSKLTEHLELESS